MLYFKFDLSYEVWRASVVKKDKIDFYADYLDWGPLLHFTDPALNPSPQTADPDKDRSGLKLLSPVRKEIRLAAFGQIWGN